MAGDPFNGVKIGLAMLLLGGVPLWWAADALLLRSTAAQLAAAGAYGVAGMTWAIIRTRRMARSERHGAK